MTSSPDGSQPHLLDLDHLRNKCRICGRLPENLIHTPVPQFDEGMDYVASLEADIRRDAIRDVLADIDGLLSQHQQRSREFADYWRTSEGSYSEISRNYAFVCQAIENIRREIAEMGEK